MLAGCNMDVGAGGPRRFGMTVPMSVKRGADLILGAGTDSLDTLPGLYWYQSTFPAPTIHSEPRAFSNSDWVKPGGNRLTSNLSRGAGGFGAFLEAVDVFFCVAAAGI